MQCDTSWCGNTRPRGKPHRNTTRGKSVLSKQGMQEALWGMLPQVQGGYVVQGAGGSVTACCGQWEAATLPGDPPCLFTLCEPMRDA